MRFRAGRRAAASSCCVRVTTLRNVTAPASLLRCATASLRSRCCARVATLPRCCPTALPCCRVSALPFWCVAALLRSVRVGAAAFVALPRFCASAFALPRCRVAALSRCRVVALPRRRAACRAALLRCCVAALLRSRFRAAVLPCRVAALLHGGFAALPRRCIAMLLRCRVVELLNAMLRRCRCASRCCILALLRRRVVAFSRRCVAALLIPSLPRCCILCKFFIVLLSGMPPVRIPLLAETSKPVVVWSDAMWELARDAEGGAFTAIDEEPGLEFYVAKAAVAFAVWDPESSRWYHSYSDVTVEVLRRLVPGKMTYIGQLEALAFACVQETFCVHNLQHVFYDRQVYAFVDKISAKFGLQRGYSSSDTGKILNACKVRQASLLSRVWFEWVPTHQNLAGLPSGGGMEEFFRVIREATGAADSRFLDLAFPNFSSWEAPLEVLVAGASKKRRRPR